MVGFFDYGIEMEVVIGVVVYEIFECVQKQDLSLIVIGSCGFSGFKYVFLGSVVDYVVCCVISLVLMVYFDEV